VAAETSIASFTILRLIKQGGQGQVYLGYDRRLRRQVAIKIHRLPASRRARRQTLDEARKIASIRSPRVVQIHDVVETRDYLAMVMEYVPGCDLADFLTAVRPTVASVITVGADLATALAAAREQGVIHGDLKAANVLITAEGRVKLTDFGIARRGEEARTQRAGSISALAPEQALGMTLDQRTDLFALGRLLYYMLTGQQPFGGSAETAVTDLLARDAIPLQTALAEAEDVPRELVLLVEQLLSKDPASRPANTHRVRHLLRLASRQLPLSTSDSLLREARPCFRPESAADIPPRIPSQLRHRGRSSSTGRWRWLARLRTVLVRSPVKVGMCTLILLGLLAPLFSLIDLERPTVYIGETRYEVNPSARVPSEISRSFLAELVRDEVERHAGGAAVSGAAGQRVYRAGATALDGDPGEKLLPGLRCSEVFCLFILQRLVGEQSESRQVLFFPEQPLEQWRQSVREAVVGLYR